VTTQLVKNGDPAGDAGPTQESRVRSSLFQLKVVTIKSFIVNFTSKSTILILFSVKAHI